MREFDLEEWLLTLPPIEGARFRPNSERVAHATEGMKSQFRGYLEREDFEGLSRLLQRVGFGNLSKRVPVPLDILALTGFNPASPRSRQTASLHRWSQNKELICPYCGERKVTVVKGHFGRWSCPHCDSSWGPWGTPIEALP